MFLKEKFGELLLAISNSYNSISEFSDKSNVNRTYLSKYINMKLENPPTPKILEKIAISSHGITSYAELMEICGYVKSVNRDELKKEEYEKDKWQILEYDFTQDELKIIEDYLLSNSQDVLFEEKYKHFEDMLLSISENKKNFLLEFCPKFFLAVSKQFIDIADENKLIFNKSNALLEETEIPSPKFFFIPVYGKIAAGIPNWAEECLDGYLPIDPNLMGIINPDECFFLRVDGESMNKEIRNGAYALIRKQDIVEDGEIAAVLVNGFEATLKKFSRQGDFIILEPMSTDDSFKTQIYDKNTQIKILGKYIGKFEMNK